MIPPLVNTCGYRLVLAVPPLVAARRVITTSRLLKTIVDKATPAL